MYKTVVIGFTKDAAQRAKLIEDKANEMYAQASPSKRCLR